MRPFLSKALPEQDGFSIFFVLAKIFAKNVCPRSYGLRRHDVGAVFDYADTTMPAQTSTTNYEGFSLTLEEQSAEIKYLRVFKYPIATVLTAQTREF